MLSSAPDVVRETLETRKNCPTKESTRRHPSLKNIGGLPTYCRCCFATGIIVNTLKLPDEEVQKENGLTLYSDIRPVVPTHPFNQYFDTNGIKWLYLWPKPSWVHNTCWNQCYSTCLHYSEPGKLRSIFRHVQLRQQGQPRGVKALIHLTSNDEYLAKSQELGFPVDPEEYLPLLF